MPSIEFHVYGDRGNAPSSDLIVSNSIKNIHFHGTYSDLEKIEVEKYSMFLLTSQWEGIPTILITMMGLGVPVVSPLVGGVGELVEEDTGWPVANFDQSEEYCRVIRQVLLDEEDRLTRQKNAKRVVGERHSWEQFVAGLKNLGLLENQNELEKVS
jgi:glycosyltransferase involved in cell wall biosynthesis